MTDHDPQNNAALTTVSPLGIGLVIAKFVESSGMGKRKGLNGQVEPAQRRAAIAAMKADRAAE